MRSRRWLLRWMLLLLFCRGTPLQRSTTAAASRERFSYGLMLTIMRRFSARTCPRQAQQAARHRCQTTSRKRSPLHATAATRVCVVVLRPRHGHERPVAGPLAGTAGAQRAHGRRRLHRRLHDRRCQVGRGLLCAQTSGARRPAQPEVARRARPHAEHDPLCSRICAGAAREDPPRPEDGAGLRVLVGRPLLPGARRARRGPATTAPRRGLAADV